MTKSAQFDKLQDSPGSLAGKLHGHGAAIDALAKRFDGMGGTLAKCRSDLDQIAADIEYLENFTPGAAPRRLQ
jgi:hypothetical protein